MRPGDVVMVRCDVVMANDVSGPVAFRAMEKMGADRVFDPGWRGSPSRGESDGGAGLGLAITRGVVESHAGDISVRNVPGGCRFEVTLPPPPPPRS